MNTIAYTQRLSMVLPEKLRLLKQFILWRAEPDKDGKIRKVPYQCTGFKASTTNPQHWSSFTFACESMRKPELEMSGMGFVFTPEDPYCGIDLDDIWQSDADEGEEWVHQAIGAFSDTYGEESPSEKGYKIWCKAKLPCSGRKWPFLGSAIEMYDQGRYFTLTGKSNKVLTIADHQADVEQWVERLNRLERSAETKYTGTSQMPEAGQISEGDRHDWLFRICVSLRWKGCCEEGIETSLMAFNHLQCQDRYDLEHIQRMIRSIRPKGGRA